MNAAHLRSLVLAVMIAMIGLVGLAPIASAHVSAAVMQTNDGSNSPCRIGTMLPGIQMTSRPMNAVIPVPTASISVDPCTLSSLLNNGDPAKVRVQADRSIPAIFVPIFKQIVISHARDLWNKDLTCPKPEDGVVFHVIIPTIWITFVPILYDAFEELHLTIICE